MGIKFHMLPNNRHSYPSISLTWNRGTVYLIGINERDLKQKLEPFKDYYNAEHTHCTLNRKTPETKTQNMISSTKFR